MTSSLRTKLGRGQIVQACAVFLLYKFAGNKNCSQRSNGCWGIWLLRLAERRMCLSSW